MAILLLVQQRTGSYLAAGAATAAAAAGYAAMGLLQRRLVGRVRQRAVSVGEYRQGV